MPHTEINEEFLRDSDTCVGWVVKDCGCNCHNCDCVCHVEDYKLEPDPCLDITYEGYLVEKKLGIALKIVYDSMNYHIRPQYRLRTGQRCDFGISAGGVTPDAVYEFDGPTHYQSSHTFRLDRTKDEIVEKEMEAHMFRIPYFVQLKGEALDYYRFPYNTVSSVTFPHGFISPNAPLPSSFTDEGLKLFCEQLNDLPRLIAEEIWATVESREKEPYKLKYIPKFALINKCLKDNGIDLLPEVVCN